MLKKDLKQYKRSQISFKIFSILIAILISLTIVSEIFLLTYAMKGNIKADEISNSIDQSYNKIDKRVDDLKDVLASL